MQPTVSIILPTYNRARFLPQAFASIRAQRFTDWELIVVDDGSTDDTRELVPRLTADMQRPVRYVYQENRGPAEARNAGLDQAVGKYVAFFDSDDEWLPHHLAECVAGLDACPDVDWVYGACQVVEDASGRVITPNTFIVEGNPRPFLALRTRRVGSLNVIEDQDAVCCMFRSGLWCGLQASVIRKTLFDKTRIPSFRVGEDRALVAMALKAGHRLGYFDDVHVVYYVHDQNSSAVGSSAVGSAADLEKRLDILKELILSREALKSELQLSRREVGALNKRISNEAFWSIGYSLLWMNGRYREAFEWYCRALRLRPFNARFWRTYLACLARYCLSDRRTRAAGAARIA